MPSSHKKVIVRRFSAERIRGYLPASGFVVEGAVDLLGLDGRRSLLPLEQVHSVAFVREFTLGDTGVADRLARRAFSGRPRGEGLWVRVNFRPDGEELEGLASAELAMLDDLIRDGGIYLTPPDTRSNTQRLFIPRMAMAEFRMLGVIRAVSRRREPALADSGAGVTSAQERLFGAAEVDVPEPGEVRTGNKEAGDDGA